MKEKELTDIRDALDIIEDLLEEREKMHMKIFERKGVRTRLIVKAERFLLRTGMKRVKNVIPRFRMPEGYEEAGVVKMAGDILHNARKQAKLSRSELAKRTGINTHYIGNIENGKINNITLKTMQRWVNATGTVVEFMIFPE
jgi:ribosome-binding protein aMBF1 (putative translation factor)